MRNNKGYTLVELIVAMAIFAVVMVEIFSMMNQTSKLYLNGTYEIELQTEAQQIVQQMEELLVDVNVSVNILPSGDPAISDTIEIVNEDVTYVISYLPDVSSVSSGSIYLTMKDTANGSIMPQGDNVLMGECVESISLNMTEYPTASKVILNLALRNDKGTYTTSKDIYLRNDVGISGNRAANHSNSSFNEELDVLRFHTYNLSSLYGANFDFAFDQKAQQDTMCATQYILNGSPSSSYTLKTNNYLNVNYNKPGGDYIIIGTDRTGEEEDIKIQISTKPVSVAADGFGLIILEGSNANYQHVGPVRVEGISLADATKVHYQYIYRTNNGSVPGNVDEERSSPEDIRSESPNLVTGGQPTINGMNYYLQYDGSVTALIDDASNSIKYMGHKMGQLDMDNGYYNLVRNAGLPCVCATFTFPNPGAELTVYSYIYVVNGPEETPDAFWIKAHSY